MTNILYIIKLNWLFVGRFYRIQQTRGNINVCRRKSFIKFIKSSIIIKRWSFFSIQRDQKSTISDQNLVWNQKLSLSIFIYIRKKKEIYIYSKKKNRTIKVGENIIIGILPNPIHWLDSLNVRYVPQVFTNWGYTEYCTMLYVHVCIVFNSCNIIFGLEGRGLTPN